MKEKKSFHLTKGLILYLLELFPSNTRDCSLKVILCDPMNGLPINFFENINESFIWLEPMRLFAWLSWRVWSWLRVNAGGMVKTCKSNDKQDFGLVDSGERVRNTWATCPWVRNSSPKGELILYVTLYRMVKWLKLVMALKDGLAAYQLVGKVKAYQG